MKPETMQEKSRSSRLVCLFASAGSSGRRERLWWGIGFFIAAIQLWYFLPGYRLSADDVMFFLAAIRGWDAVWEFSQRVAYEQGRIGGFLLVPINAYAAYFSEHLVFRVILVVLDFLTLALFALWAQRVTGRRVAAILFVYLISLHALDYLHLSPNAFPLQNTLPFAVIILARISLHASPTPASRIGWYMVMGLAMLTSEYAILIGGALVCIEAFALFIQHGIADGVRRLLRSGRTWADLGVVILAVLAYLAWRLAHPSGYEGNQIGITSWPLFAQTWTLHAFGLLAMPFYLPQIPSWPDFFAIGSSAILMATATWHMWDFDTPRPGRRWALVGPVFALLVALPASATQKQQSYCADDVLGCVFLDSRAAYFFAILGLVFALMTLASHYGQKTRILASVILGVWVFGMMAHNAGASLRMQGTEQAWHRAAEMACASDSVPGQLDARIDPNRRVFIHSEGLDDSRFYPGREQFWEAYLVWKRQAHCNI